MAESTCQRCGTRLAPGGNCPKCLLETVFPFDGQEASERIFQAALAFPAGERESFIRSAAGGNEAVLSDALLLLQGYEGEGGDDAMPTMGMARDARAEATATIGEEAGQEIDGFLLLEKIGEGGMGVVWKARQSVPVAREVALKVIKLGMDTREVVARFERERQTLALMSHPHIARVFAAGSTLLGRPYFVMELVEGEPVTSHCEARDLDIEERVRLMFTICSAVGHAHQKGVIHRDLKPSNILVSADGFPKIIDFGIAKATTAEQVPEHTRQAQVLGTPSYMSPEQALSGSADLDTRTDVYSLGAVLYEMLAGRPPFDPDRLASTGVAEMQRILREETPPRPSTRAGMGAGGSGRPPVALAFSDDLDWIVMKACAKERERRYPGVAALAEDLERYLKKEPVTAAPPSAFYTLHKFYQRHKTAALSFVTLLLALAGGLALALKQNARVREALDAEELARQKSILTIADLYTKSGVDAAARGEEEVASLWFAQAAVTGRSDPDRFQSNRTRATSWSQRFPQLVRAFDSGEEYVSALRWNPRQPALIAYIENVYYPQIWDLTGAPKRWPLPVPDAAFAIWSHDGARLAVVTPDRMVVLGYPSGELVAELALSQNITCRPCWHPDGESLYFTEPGRLAQWFPATGDVRNFPLATTTRGISIDASGARLLLADRDSISCRSSSAPFEATVPAREIYPLSQPVFLADGRHFLALNREGGLEVIDSDRGDILETYGGEVGMQNAGIKVWASPSGRYLAREGHALVDRLHPDVPGPVLWGFEIAFDSDETRVASRDERNQIILHSLPSGEFAGGVGDCHLPPLALAFSPDARFLAYSEHGYVRVSAFPEPLEITRIPQADQAGGFVALSSDEELLLPTGHARPDAKLRSTRVFHTRTGDEAGAVMAEEGLILDGTFVPGTNLVALAVATSRERSMDAMPSNPGTGYVRIRDYGTGESIIGPIAMPSEPRGLAAHPSGGVIAVVCSGGERFEIDAKTGEVRPLFENPYCRSGNGNLSNNGRCRYSPDGRYLAVWGSWSESVWDRKEGRLLVAPREMESTVFDLDFAGSIQASALIIRGERIEFRDLKTGREARPALSYNSWPMVCRFDTSGRRLLIAGDDKRARVIDWRSARPLGPDIDVGQIILCGAFLPMDDAVVLGGNSPEVSIHEIASAFPLCPAWVHGGGWVLDVKVIHGGETLLVTTQYGEPSLIELRQLLATAGESPEDALLHAEINANAFIGQNGGLHRLTLPEWQERWRKWRASHQREIKFD